MISNLTWKVGRTLIANGNVCYKHFYLLTLKDLVAIMDYFRVTVVLLIGVTICCLFTSCGLKFSTTPTQKWFDGEFRNSGFQEYDTILDYSIGQSEIIPVIASSVNHLHFYLPSTKIFGINRKWTEKSIKNFHEDFHSTNLLTFQRVEEKDDSIYLPNNSVNKILCRFSIYSFDNIDAFMLEFNRVLKPNGKLLLLVKCFESEEMNAEQQKFLYGKPNSNEKSLVGYLEPLGFHFEKSYKITFNEQIFYDFPTKFSNDRQTLFIFTKTTGL